MNAAELATGAAQVAAAVLILALAGPSFTADRRPASSSSSSTNPKEHTAP